MTAGGDVEPPLMVHARRYAAAPVSDNARSNFVVRLQVCDDVQLLRRVAREFSLTPEIALAAWGRIASLAAGDPGVIVEAAAAFYSHGYDEAAIDLVTRALEQDDRCLAALELKAALTPDAAERRRVFEQILRIDPGNRVAVDNLILLDRPR